MTALKSLMGMIGFKGLIGIALAIGFVWHSHNMIAAGEKRERERWEAEQAAFEAEIETLNDQLDDLSKSHAAETAALEERLANEQADIGEADDTRPVLGPDVWMRIQRNR